MRHTTIIATIGPVTESAEMIGKLINAGVDVFRMNFSHGDHSTHKKIFRSIRREAKNRGKYVGILQDLQGPKIRVGTMENGGAKLTSGAEVTIVTKEVIGNSEVISTTYKHLPKDVKKNDRILLDDGNLELKVLQTSKESVKCVVVDGGVLKSKKGINLPGVAVSSPSLTQKDISDLKLGLELGVDMVAVSFVRKPEDIDDARAHIRKAGADIPVIAKIERPEAIKNLKKILDKADAVMVARGDLGVEMPPERVPDLQKTIIREANERGKVAITATQMLESMIANPRPTRAEASDVANAVMDGTDAVMLSGETAVGAYPVEAVDMMSRICGESERHILNKLMIEPSRFLFSAAGFSGAVAYSAARTARELGAKGIVAFTQSGTTAQLVSKFRPECAVIGATLKEDVAYRMSLLWGVVPVVFDKVHKIESLVADVDEQLIQTKMFKKGDIVVITSGVPISASGSTNLMKIHRIGESD
ncbi:MAG TPA: pyruvate kinase [bacterium]|nr:pyruvate kinase [bacterium]